MKRITVSLPDDLADIVQTDARRRRTSVSEVMRAAITTHYKLDQPREVPFANLFHSGLPDLGSNMDHYLETEWVDWLERESFNRDP